MSENHPHGQNWLPPLPLPSRARLCPPAMLAPSAAYAPDGSVTPALRRARRRGSGVSPVATSGQEGGRDLAGCRREKSLLDLALKPSLSNQRPTGGTSAAKCPLGLMDAAGLGAAWTSPPLAPPSSPPTKGFCCRSPSCTVQGRGQG